MLNDKIRETDWELTDDAIQEQVARESYLQYLQDCQKRDRRRPVCIHLNAFAGTKACDMNMNCNALGMSPNPPAISHGATL